MKTGKSIHASNGWRALHTDFINNKELDGYHVTFVNGIDDPIPPPDPDRDRAMELTEKFETDGTLSPTELMEFLKLKLVKGK